MENTVQPKPDLSFTSVQGIIEFHKLPSYLKELIAARISRRQVKNFKETSELNYDVIATLIGTSKRNIFFKESHFFGISISQSIVRLIDLYGYGYSKFHDPLLFNRWMYTGSPEHGYRPPYLLFLEEDGIREIRTEILRISDLTIGLYKLPDQQDQRF